jgi:hypothetical protein
VWVPRWSNVFGNDIMPLDTPPLLNGLPEDDKKCLTTDETNPLNDHLNPNDDRQSSVVSSNRPRLTPDSVNEQFNIPGIFEQREKMFKEE